LIMKRKIVPELLQAQCAPQNLIHHLRQILSTENRNELLSTYEELRNKLHHDQDISDLIADKMIKSLKKLRRS
jgi:lipid A disaccharide synthetase